MFTVKVVTTHQHAGTQQTPPHETKDEQIFESSGVRKQGDTIYVDVTDGMAEYTVEPPAVRDYAAIMYVMNRFGATVATYHL